MKKIKARISAANKIYYSLQTIFRTQGIHRNNKIRVVARPVLWYGSISLNWLNTCYMYLKGKY